MTCDVSFGLLVHVARYALNAARAITFVCGIAECSMLCAAWQRACCVLQAWLEGLHDCDSEVLCVKLTSVCSCEHVEGWSPRQCTRCADSSFFISDKLAAACLLP
jgi:hypothetical protein